MDLSVLGTLVQTVGAVLLALTFFYLSRGSGSRVLKAAGWGWLFLFLSLASLFAAMQRDFPYEKLPFQYFKLLYLAALVVAADRIDHDFPIGRPIAWSALLALPVSFAVVSLPGSGSVFSAAHMGLCAVGWFVITILILRSRARGLGRQFSALLATATAIAQVGYVLLFALSAQRGNGPVFFLSFIGFVDLFLEMLFGMGLIIWAMEDTEARLAMVHARTVGETQRTKRRAHLIR